MKEFNSQRNWGPLGLIGFPMAGESQAKLDIFEEIQWKPLQSVRASGFRSVAFGLVKAFKKRSYFCSFMCFQDTFNEVNLHFLDLLERNYRDRFEVTNLQPHLSLPSDLAERGVGRGGAG